MKAHKITEGLWPNVDKVSRFQKLFFFVTDVKTKIS